MLNPDELKYSLQNLVKRKLRSSLTILSILIGIASIFALVSFGQGIQNYVDELGEKAGVDKLFVQASGIGAPGTDDNFYISKSDVNFIDKIKGVGESAALYMKPAKIEFNKQTKYNYLSGYDISKTDLVMTSFGIDVYSGRQLKKEEMGKVALGYNYQFENKVFKKAVKLGDKVEINDVSYEVVGFYEEVGNPADDANIYLSDKAFEELYPDSKDKFGFVMIQAAKGAKPSELAEKIKEKLRKHKGQDKGKEDFYVQTFEDALQTFTSVIGVLNGVLVLIALISLVVASVNIMNTMYTAVLERTKEIGILKSVGARNNDILFIFVFESSTLGFIGGGIGIFLGYLISSLGGNIAKAAGYAALQPIFPLWLIIGCLIFSSLVGAAAGLLPAWRASKLSPVDALRYE